MSEKWAPSISRKKWLKLKAALSFGIKYDENMETVKWFCKLIDEMETEHENNKWRLRNGEWWVRDEE